MTRKSLRGAVFRNKQRRRVAQDISAYPKDAASLGTAAIGDSLDAFSVPANANLAIAIDTATSTGDITVTCGDRTIGIAGGAEDTLFRLGWIERGHEVIINRISAGAGQVGLFVLDDWGREMLVASGEFTS